MKKLLISAGAVTALALSTPAFALNPNQAQANATVNIVAPLSVTQVSGADLNFGTVVAPAGGFLGTETVEIDNTGAQLCSGTLTCAGTPSVAQFTVTGTPGQALVYTIDDTVTLTGPGSDITVDTTAAADRIEPADTGTGSVTLVVGGAMTIPASEANGVYSGTLNVQADYQ